MITKYLDIILMTLWSWKFSPGSAAILAAFGAGWTPALPGKTMQEFLSRYLDAARRLCGLLEHQLGLAVVAEASIHADRGFVTGAFRAGPRASYSRMAPPSVCM
jgi:hypothetical protein